MVNIGTTANAAVVNMAEKKYGDKWSDLNKRVAAFKMKQEQQQKRQSKSEAPISKPVEQKPVEIKKSQPPKKLKNVEEDFETLMKLAKQNNNEIRKHEPPKPPLPRPKSMLSSKTSVSKKPVTSQIAAKQNSVMTERPRQMSKQNSNRADLDKRIAAHKMRQQGSMIIASSSQRIPPPSGYARRPISNMNYRGGKPNPYYEEDDYYDEKDDYEEDGFVVDEYDDEAQEELNKTLKSVFRYDKRRCDRREEELDRQYRAIGRVSTFEDLEREERRAARLAAAEDAKAQKEEDERKRLKKIRLQKVK